MATPLLKTKLYIPPVRPNLVPRPPLVQRLDEGLRLGRKLTLVSAPAGYGKTTLLSEWVAGCGRLEPEVRCAWLSLDEGDNDPTRFLAYFVATLQTIYVGVGSTVLRALQSPQPPPVESVLAGLVNEIAATSSEQGFLFVLDDYHVIDTRAIQGALRFLLEHQPPQMHLVIGTRKDPPLPLARLRARGLMTEIRASDLRFTEEEASAFLNQAIGLNLAPDEVAALETRTEGWIAGLQMAAFSLERQTDRSTFIKAFAGDDRHVMDYSVDEVLSQQSEDVRGFLLGTSILDRLYGPLCDAVVEAELSDRSQDILEYLE